MTPSFRTLAAAAAVALAFVGVISADGSPPLPLQAAVAAPAGACADSANATQMLSAEGMEAFGGPVSCAVLAAMHACNHPKLGAKIREHCKATCGICPGTCDPDDANVTATANGSDAAAIDTATAPGDNDDDDDSAASFTVWEKASINVIRYNIATLTTRADEAEARAGTAEAAADDLRVALGQQIEKLELDLAAVTAAVTVAPDSTTPDSEGYARVTLAPASEREGQGRAYQSCSGAALIVANAGAEEVNGVYFRVGESYQFRDGDLNGKPQYWHCDHQTDLDRIKIYWTAPLAGTWESPHAVNGYDYGWVIYGVRGPTENELARVHVQLEASQNDNPNLLHGVNYYGVGGSNGGTPPTVLEVNYGRAPAPTVTMI